ncbi:hypothetical protein Tco_1449198 [Tanacetum coccineum]
MLVMWWCVGVVVFDDGVDIVVMWVSVSWRMVVVKMMMVIVVRGVVWDSSGSGFDDDGGRLFVVMVRRWIRTRFSSRGYEEKKVMVRTFCFGGYKIRFGDIRVFPANPNSEYEDIDFEDNLFGLYGDEDLTNLAKCLIIENEDFVKEIAVCLYIRSMSSTSWIVQDIRHKLGRFNFFIKILIVHIFNHLRGSVHKLHIYTRPLFDDDKKGKNIDTEDLRLVEPW